MAQVKGVEGMSETQIRAEVMLGARFVMYQWCISFIVMTIKRGSAVHFIRPGESALTKSLPYTLLTLVAGWWGLPWGPIYSIQSLFRNLRGGIDLTQQMTPAAPPAATLME